MTLFVVAFLAGVLTAFAPCILPLLPVIVGRSVGGALDVRRLLTVCAALGASIVAFTLLLKASTALIAIPAQTWALISGTIIASFGLVALFPGLWERLPGRGIARACVQSDTGNGTYASLVLGGCDRRRITRAHLLNL